jgi:hypothetical protein
MRFNRGRAIGRFLEDLSVGDLIAVGLVTTVVAIGGFGLFVLTVRRDLRRADETRARRYGRKSS